MQGSKTKYCGQIISQPKIMVNPAATEQPKTAILGHNLFANGSGKVVACHTDKCTDRQLGNLQKLVLEKLSMSLIACDTSLFARKRGLSVHCNFVYPVHPV